jgi:hypothetical protein
LSEIYNWSIKLAESSAPYEIDLAHDILNAYLEGGNSRAELFKKEPSSNAGGFGLGGFSALLPFVFEGIAAASKWIISLISSDKISNILGVITDAKDLLSIGQKDRARNKLKQISNAEKYESMRKTIDIIGSELKAAGIEKDEADLITFRVIVSLLENPEGTIDFIESASK